MSEGFDYVKIKKFGKIFYIRTPILSDIKTGSEMDFTAISDFVLDTSNNSILKCRHRLDEVFDFYTGC
jgi:hypothetical protein